MVLIAGVKKDTLNTGLDAPTGWTAVPNFPHSHSSGNPAPRSLLAYRIKQAGDAAPVVDSGYGVPPATAPALIAVIASVAPDFDVSNPLDLPGAGVPVDSVSGTTVTSNDHTPALADELIFFVAWAANAGLTAGTTVSGYSGANPALVEQVDTNRVGGSNGGNLTLAVAAGPTTSVAALGARTATLAAARLNSGALFGIRPAARRGLAMLI